MSTIQTDREDFSVTVGGKAFRGWQNLAIEWPLDSFRACSFSTPFDPKNAELREMFRPLKYRPVETFVNGETLFKGRYLDLSPGAAASGTVLEVSAASYAGAIADCCAPAHTLPLELKGLDLREIAKKLSEAINVRVLVPPHVEVGAPFKKIAVEPTTKIYGFLIGLAKQRGLIIRDTTNGELVLDQPNTNSPVVARLVEGTPPVSVVTMSASSSNYFSELTGLSKAKKGSKGARFTVENPMLRDVVRSSSISFDEVDGDDVANATLAAMSRMFASAITYGVTMPTIRNAYGDLWEPGPSVLLTAPNAMVYRETRFLIRKVSVSKTAEGHSATLGLSLPCAFSGVLPDRLPWDE